MKATIKIGEVKYDGQFTLDCFYTDLHWWKFKFDNHDGIYRFGTLNAEQRGTREEALADAKRHGIQIIDGDG